ncbi:CpaD family pilus assembly lipoprotein [Azospirillum picis]|uniref:Pilus assembly protein CpaD n=1 Tax=Azospirillum picis TaxID=488438 RepID=A0ABU0MN81_9PROT|nr:CpaD family pilus assembly lipoprotein [Azospirillum picis]MBP2301112.1 pilus assembly protein CpaD [Azospirillum picis]MDQ0534926.1 pilus assembly protein CpaD [Azospirillum picis]
MRTPIAPPLAVLGVLIASAALPGCSPQPIYQEETAVQQQLTVAQSAEETTLDLPPGRRSLDGATIELLRRFARMDGNPYAAHILLTPGDRVEEATLRNVLATLAAAGVPDRNMGVSSANRPAGRMLHLRRETAVLVIPDCPPLTRDTLLERENDTAFDLGRKALPPPRLGCATAANLGLMLADPRDLAEPQRSGPAAGAVMEDSVQRYRTNTPLRLDGGGASSASTTAR